MSGFGRIVLDEDRGQLFLSEGPRGGGVRVVSLTGAPVSPVAGLESATGMALSPDGLSLWVALPAQGCSSGSTPAASRWPRP